MIYYIYHPKKKNGHWRFSGILNPRSPSPGIFDLAHKLWAIMKNPHHEELGSPKIPSQSHLCSGTLNKLFSKMKKA